MESNTIQDTIANVREKFKDVRKLLDDHEKFSTETKPYKIKYQAIDVLKSMEMDLIKILADMPEEEKGEEIIMLAVIHLNLGLLYADTEELQMGEEQFMKCLKLLENKELEPEAVLPVLSTLNQLGLIWSQWNQPTKAKEFLDQAEKIYNDFIDTNNPCRDPINMAQNFGIEQVKDELSPKEVLEKVHTLTLYYLAQVYSSLKDHRQSAIYCHMTLRRQLGDNDIMQDLDCIDWALNAATLSQYFMSNDGFSQARHHLAAASYILQRHRSADVARCWAKYGILLMSLSKQRLLEKNESEEENDQSKLNNKDPSKSTIIESLKFDVLEKDIEPIAVQITDKYLLDSTDSRIVFFNVLKWLEQAKAYYTLENHASDHILIVQDISQAYKYLSFFTETETEQLCLHQRRKTILENVLKELNPQYYQSACRQIWFELGEIYSDMRDIWYDRARSSDKKPVLHTLKQSNRLAMSAIKNFQAFLDSIQTRNCNSEIEQFPNEVMQPALFSYFHLGRLYNKIITSDKAVQLKNAQNSINAYKFVIDYCEKYPKAAEVMKIELSLCKELVSVLPIKINMLREQMMDR
ncbi:unnamed protein product [Xylocopa violacea]|uniref:KIF-binding protein n=1 Tax=Xylocopa violacea TaxID=135666 RepID=A0ABP1P9U7_XYLVO